MPIVNPDNTTAEIILRNGDFVHREVRERVLGNQDVLLSQLADSGGYSLTNLGLTPKGRRLLMSVNKTGLMLATELTELPFKCVFGRGRDAATDYYIPTWEAPTAGAALESQPYPTRLLGGRVFWSVYFEDQGNRALIASTCWMGVVFQGEKEMRHFNYPNHYNDGKICMGDDWANVSHQQSNISFFDQSLDSFLTTLGNADLRTGNTQHIFRKDLDGEWAPPVFDTEAMKSACPILSNRYINQLLAACDHGNP